MANLRQLSIFSLSLAILAGSSFSLNCGAEPTQLENPPPSKKVFFENDLWQHAANKEWAFSHLLLSAIRESGRNKIDKLQVTDATKASLDAVRVAFNASDTQGLVETGSISDLTYAYSTDNASSLSYLFSGLQLLVNKIDGTAEYLSFYKEHKAKVLGTTFGVGALTAGGIALAKLCKAPAQNPPAGRFLVKHVKYVGANLGAAGAAFWAGITAHPYVLLVVGSTYLAYETCVTIGNMFYDVPTAMMYYTDRICAGDGSAQSGTYTNTAYGFSSEPAEVHYRGYINMNTYNTMLHGFLSYGKRMNQLQFGAIPPHAVVALEQISNAKYLSPEIFTPFLPDYFDRRGSDYTVSREKHRKHVKEAVDKVVDPSNPATDCRKFVLFNDSLFSDNSTPLYLFSLCSIGDTFAYAKLPAFPYARMKKTEVVGLVQELMEYTGSTRLVAMSATKK